MPPSQEPSGATSKPPEKKRARETGLDESGQTDRQTDRHRARSSSSSRSHLLPSSLCLLRRGSEAPTKASPGFCSLRLVPPPPDGRRRRQAGWQEPLSLGSRGAGAGVEVEVRMPGEMPQPQAHPTHWAGRRTDANMRRRRRIMLPGLYANYHRERLD